MNSLRKGLMILGCVTAVFSMALIVANLLPASFSNTHCLDIGGCQDSCPKGTVCGPACGGCSGCVIIFDTPKMEFDLDALNGVSPSWNPGTEYAVSLKSASAFSIATQSEWGKDIVSGLQPSSAGGHVTFVATQDKGQPEIRVDSLTAQIPTFAHSLTGSEGTGTNSYTLDPSFVSTGIIDTKTGEVSKLRLYMLLTNSYIAASSPARVVMDCSGTIDLSSRVMTLEVQDAHGFPGLY